MKVRAGRGTIFLKAWRLDSLWLVRLSLKGQTSLAVKGQTRHVFRQVFYGTYTEKLAHAHSVCTRPFFQGHGDEARRCMSMASFVLPYCQIEWMQLFVDPRLARCFSHWNVSGVELDVGEKFPVLFCVVLRWNEWFYQLWILSGAFGRRLLLYVKFTFLKSWLHHCKSLKRLHKHDIWNDL